MKRFFTSLICLFIVFALPTALHAQGIYQFWGVTDYGGSQEEGVLFSAKDDGTAVRRRQAFELYTPGMGNRGQDMVAFNGKLYGLMPKAGRLEKGIIYEFDPANNTYIPKADLHTLNNEDTELDLYLLPGSMVNLNGRLFGVVGSSAAGDRSYLFEFVPATGQLIKLYTFVSNGPSNGLTVYNNKLYGVRRSLGGNGTGRIYSFDPNSNFYSELATLDNSIANSISDQMILYNGRLYGTSSLGAPNQIGGVLFEFNPANNQFTIKVELGSIEAYDAGGLTVYGNKLYGASRVGGAHNSGVIYEFNPANNNLVKRADIAPITGSEMNGAFRVFNNKLYGLTGYGGSQSYGTVIEFDPATGACTKKVTLSPTGGSNPHGNLVWLNDRFYGVTRLGGTYDRGVIFEYRPDVNGYVKKIDLGVNNGLRPSGRLTYYNGKLYGTTTEGGEHNLGVIYSYDLVTRLYTVHHHMSEATGAPMFQGGMILHNSKMYGVTGKGGNGNGVLYVFDPVSNEYTVKHVFSGTDGRSPRGVPVVFNNKLYGTTAGGGATDDGVLYEYNLLTNSYAVRVHLGGSFGSAGLASLTVFGDKLYGTTWQEGTYNEGTLFEYTPSVNGFAVRHHFQHADGTSPSSAMVVYNNMLWGTTDSDGADFLGGTLFVFNPANGMFVKKHDFQLPDAQQATTDLVVHKNKMYGMAAYGGTLHFGGTLFEYDPNNDIYNNKTDFTITNGRKPLRNRLTVLPALTAPGTPGSCYTLATQQINLDNNNEWVAFTDDEGNAVAEIHPHGNLLGDVTIRFYTHDGPARHDAAGRFYLDRNISIEVTKQPVAPVSIRLYIRKSEYESLKSTPGAAILNIDDITIFKSDDDCSKGLQGKATPLAATVSAWGMDYVFAADITSFSSFYFANKAYSALPVKLEYFRGKAEAAANVLEWKASCTDDLNFVVERSADGVVFEPIGKVAATYTDCSHPFHFADKAPLPGKSYYRLHMQESNGQSTYSAIVPLTRTSGTVLSVRLTPNPVTGSGAIFTIASPTAKRLHIAVYNASGKLEMNGEIAVQPGVQTRTIDVQALPAGIYVAVVRDGAETQTIRFVRK